MWIVVVITTLASLIGFQSMTAQATLLSRSDVGLASMLAANMASYRFGVIAYANANPAFTGVVQQPLFPTGYVALQPSLWSNQVLADGTIVIYASRLPPVAIDDALAVLSWHSVLAGRINKKKGKIDVAKLPEADAAGLPVLTALPDQSPVWLAHRQ